MLAGVSEFSCRLARRVWQICGIELSADQFARLTLSAPIPEDTFRVIKRQLGYVKTRFRGLAKNTVQLTMLFALSNLWMVRRQLLSAAGQVQP